MCLVLKFCGFVCENRYTSRSVKVWTDIFLCAKRDQALT